MKKQNKSHAVTKLLLKIFGFLFIAAAIVFIAVGFASFFGAMNGEGMPDKFWACFVGFFLLVIGIGMLSFGFRKEITRYVKNESAPVINEFAEDIKPAVQSFASAVRETSAPAQGAPCPRCGEQNDADAKFCKNCGAVLQKVCPACGNKADPAAKFCDNCGHRF